MSETETKSQAEMASETATAPANTLNLNLVEVLNLAAKLLNQMFLVAPKDKAKPVFKAIKNGEQVVLGTMTIDQKLKSNLKLALDYSEFQGPGFNFDVFKAGLQAILKQVSDTFRTKAKPNILQSDEGTVLVHLPGFVEINNQLNVLVLAFELARLEAIVIKLMYLEPGQYEAFRKK